MTRPSAPSPPLVREALEPWCAAAATGVLRALDPPGGRIYLTAGRIAYAESPLACGVSRLLTASGRLSMEEFRRVLSAGRASGDIGRELVRARVLTPIEVEVVFHAALYGAMHFLFDTRSEVRFEMGVRHPMGTAIELELETARVEIARRQRALHEALPDDSVDARPVAPVRRLDGHNVSLTALQWELVVAARGRRTPIDLARVLGRDTYATLIQARRLIKSGLLEPVGAPVPTAVPKKAPAASEIVTKPAATASEPATKTGTSRARARPATKRASRGSAEVTTLPQRPNAEPANGWTDVDMTWPEETLTRIRDALQALP